MEKSIEDLLSEDEDTVETVVDTSDHVTTTLEQPRDVSGRFASNETGVETQETADPVPPTNKLPQEDYKAIREEREKRQTLERELEALRKTVQSYQQPKEPAAPPPSVWEDEQAYGGHIVSTAVQQATFNAKLDMSEMMTRQANPDFEDMKAKFLEMASQNPSLQQQAIADPHPWNKAYQIAKNAAKMEALGAVDVSELETKIREQIMAEMQVNPTPRQTVPASLTNERNVGTRSGPAWTGPKPLSELLG